MPNEGNYQASKTIQSGSGWGSQFLILSRVNDSNWSFPSFQDKQYLIITFEMTGGCWGKSFRLAFDQNNDGNLGQNCGQADPNEASFGINWFACGTPTKLELFDASSQIIAQQDNYAVSGWIRYMLVIDFYAFNFQGSISVYTKHLSASQSNWTPVPSMQNKNLNFNLSSNANDNPYNLNAIMLSHQAGSNSTFDNFTFNVMNFSNDTVKLCEGDSVKIGVESNQYSYLWNTGDTTALINVDSEGLYFVDLIIDENAIIRDSTYVQKIRNISLFDDVTFCKNETLTLKANFNMDSLKWDDGSKSYHFQIANAGTYSVMYYKDGCVSHDTIKAVSLPSPYLELGNDTVICPNTNYVITPSTNATEFEWQDGNTQMQYNIKKSGKYILKVFNESQCSAVDSISILLLNDLKLGNDTTICEGDHFKLQIDTIFSEYIWSDGSNESFLNIETKGEYFLTAKLNSCVLKSDTILIDRILLPKIITPMVDSLICNDLPIILKTDIENYEELKWFDLTSEPTKTVHKTGEYWVKASNQCGSVVDVVNVSYEDCKCNIFLPNVFTPNEDKINDEFGFQSDCKKPSIYELKIFNRWGDLIFISYDYEEKWYGYYKGRVCPDGIYSYNLKLEFEHNNEKLNINRKLLLAK